MAGWGHDVNEQNQTNDNMNSHPYLNELGLNVIGRDYCTAYSQQGFLDGAGPNDFCAGNPVVENGQFVSNQPVACDDTGVPLICDVNGFATIVGIQRGIAQCNLSSGMSNIMTRIGDIDNYSWITNTIFDNQPQSGYEDSTRPMPSAMTCSRPSIDNSAAIFSNDDIYTVQNDSANTEAFRYTAIVEFGPDSSTNDFISSTCYYISIRSYCTSRMLPQCFYDATKHS